MNFILSAFIGSWTQWSNWQIHEARYVLLQELWVLNIKTEKSLKAIYNYMYMYIKKHLSFRKKVSIATPSTDPWDWVGQEVMSSPEHTPDVKILTSLHLIDQWSVGVNLTLVHYETGTYMYIYICVKAAVLQMLKK